ncbi:flagellar biosynthesis protein [Keratinibaculum paraultunense]|uniref:Flagellar biosynthesis protein n=1 Tax=Keratinibaculum paraultunense TaxID=1278232 RepID=A0A4R3KVH8_9FIRM|nr:EscU/YscU/HrcU family type III secretion system export apparatus switch protein [Keratinibaculum paraultunense]QQY80749.1 EscU/YscU/HrcU family type III secretion system export apparatus switch protein [Keratinibaculum paraultunense]TCS89641.1 flagellar biosynthesis protein [Keratinibaculum paraultunense]
MKQGKNKIIKKAVALSYKKEYNAPKVIAKGKGEIAEKIIEKGHKEGIEIYKDEKLIEDLIKLDLHEEIPEELYEAVSEIILFVYLLDKEKGGSRD